MLINQSVLMKLYKSRYNKDYNFQMQQLDDQAFNELLQQGSLVNSGNLLCQTNLKKYGQEIQIRIYQNGITETKLLFPQQIHSFSYKFDIKYSFQVNPPVIHFYKANNKFSYYLDDILTLEVWRNILKRKLNQIGFHQQFKPIKKLGKGNFATVFAALKKQNEITYAVKAFSKQAVYSQQNGKQTVIKQIEVMRCLYHQNVMKLQQVFESDNSLYVVFEYLEGGQLNQQFKENRIFNPIEVKKIMKGLLSGVAHLHQKKIMHRDLKPQNILLRNSQNLEVVIADFGLAEFSNLQEYLFVRCGTPGFVAPQILNIKDLCSTYDQVCDIFSLGLIFHILLFNKSIFNSTVYSEVLRLNRFFNFSFEASQFKNLENDTLDLLKQMLNKNPHQRISAKDALNHRYFQKDQDNETMGSLLGDIKHFFKSSKVKPQVLKTQPNQQGKFRKKVSTIHDKLIQIKNKILSFRS